MTPRPPGPDGHPGAGSDPAERSPLAYPGDDLEAMAPAVNYRRWIVDEFVPFLGSRVAEVGAGRGYVTELLAGSATRHVSAFEPAARMYALLERRFRGRPDIATYPAYLGESGGPDRGSCFDSLVYVNVLEHVEDDAAELMRAHGVLCAGGHLCIFVPALPVLYSAFDASIGHHRRYRRKELADLLQRAGFTILRLRYMDLVGAAGWLLLLRFGRRPLERGQVALYDRWVVPLMRRVESALPLPVGKNLLCVARKPLPAGGPGTGAARSAESRGRGQGS
jgi:SAM-dependent methyltransferase